MEAALVRIVDNTTERIRPRKVKRRERYFYACLEAYRMNQSQSFRDRMTEALEAMRP